MLHHSKYILLIFLLLSCSKQTKDSPQLKGRELLQKSISVHDPNGKWANLEFAVHIQEPRIGNPARYSILKMNNTTGAFELIRNREKHLSKHTIDESNQAKVFLDDSEEIADSLVKKFRLKPERNDGYREFYKMLYGLPMSLDDEWVKDIGAVEMSDFRGQMCYRIPIELQQKMFSKHWVIYLSKSSNEFKGMEIIFPEDKTKGERLYFEGTINIDEVNIPRIRHWHEYSNDDYSGSDIVLKELQN